MMKVTASLCFLTLTLFAPPLLAGGAIDCNLLQPPPARAWCRAQDYKKLEKQSREPFTFTKEYNKEGDSHFKNKAYRQAADAYDLAISNSPNVYAYLREGDASMKVPSSSK